MVQSRTGTGKTAAFGIPFANGIVVPEDKRAGDDPAADARAGAAGRARAGAHLRAPRHQVVADLRRRADGQADRAAARRARRSSAARPAACSITCAAARSRLDKVRCAVLDEGDEMLSMGFQEDIERILEARPTSGRRCSSRRRCPKASSAGAPVPAQPRDAHAVGRHVSALEIRHVYYSSPACHREKELLRILEVEDPKRPSSSATRARRPDASPGSCASRPRRRGDLVAISRRPTASASWAGCARAASGSWSRPTSRPAASTSRTCRTSSTARSPSRPSPTSTAPAARPRGAEGHGDLAHRPDRGRHVLLLAAAYKIKPEERALPSESEIRAHREGERILELRRALEGDPETNGVRWRDG